MFYKQFLKIINANSDFVTEFDYWLATIPESKQDNISASFISAHFNVPYSLADNVLKFAKSVRILEEYYLVQCPDEDCNMPIDKVSLNELAEVLMKPVFCTNCFKEYMIKPNNIYTVYRRIIKPDVSEDEINAEILKRLNFSNSGNFNQADSLDARSFVLYDAFYNPNKSAYDKLKEKRKELDYDYGKKTKDKGDSLEILVLELFKNVKFVTGTKEIKTHTNQLDCTKGATISTFYPSVFNYLSPYFIVECKNEPDKTHSNTYFHKLSSILDSNEAKVGIVFSRKPAARESLEIAYHQYLINKANQGKYMISMSDSDLKILIDDRENLLKYIDFKILSLTTNSRNAKFEMFKQTEGKKVE